MSRLFFTQVNQASDLTGASIPGARAFFYENKTTTQVTVYADATVETPLAQPVLGKPDGTFPAVYIPGPGLIRINVTDVNGVSLPGYPIDDVDTSGAGGSAANVTFSPSEAVPAKTVQAAIDHVAAQVQAPNGLLDRTMTAWGTTGTGNAYVISPTPEIVALTAPLSFLIRPNRENTGAATLNVNGLGARPLQKIGSDGNPVYLAPGEIAAWVPLLVAYDGERWVVTLGETGYTGANENGTFVRHPYGWQECQLLTAGPFVFDSANLVRFAWTFPMPFSQTPWVGISGTIGNDNYIGLGQRDLGWFRYSGNGIAVECQIFRVNGSTRAFEAGDEIHNARLAAFGRY